ncbi:uncharacterized protein BX663DRAFT_498779 [Cokeromyces recurvatus]|uniref:uncharacterized protein n=1 Tax=Cokeromyces recurvatus TaxID=90255 RepID=UPI00222025B9|nr:uncharacterized protein BX663DRAFT_498779 [Cokeromyces recurvatus]KAI7906100.1 hypothetical protein BX663DRAFT_498779 [Cokeromyces recurvatus]
MFQTSNDLINDKQIKEHKPLHRRSFPICPKCNQSCSKEDTLVRAFNQVYHYKCFICEDCFIPVANKYYPIDDQQQQKYRRRKLLVVCEYHYLKRLGLICLKCDKPIASNERYHPECIQCPLCVTPTTIHYDYKGQSYCRLHFSLIPETHCAGCEQAILKQFVEHRNLPNQIWHPECYMILKFWNVKLKPTKKQMDHSNLIDNQTKIHQKVKRIWTDLSSFEESSASCISDMLLNVAAGAYTESIRMANQFIMHLEILFSALDLIQQQLKLHHQELNCSQESSSICDQLIRFLQLLATCKKSDIATTQELLELITGLAHNLKTLIRIGLLYALNLEQEFGIQNGINQFLDQLSGLEKKRVWIAGRYWFKDNLPMASTINEEICHQCNQSLKDTDCFLYQLQYLKWHPHCFSCSVCSSLNESNTNSMLLYSSVNNALYCQNCFNSTEHKENDSNMRCTYVSLLQQNLQNMKVCLTKISLTTNNDIKLKEETHKKIIREKERPERLLPQTKRQGSILQILGQRAMLQRHQESTSNNLTNRANSIKMGQVEKKTSSFGAVTNLKKKKENSLMISTSPVFNTEKSSSQQEETLSPVTSFMSPIRQRSNKLARSLRRTFSTHSENNSNKMDTKRRKSSTCYDLFDYQQQNGLRGPRKASLLASIMDEIPSSSIILPNKTIRIYIATLTLSQDFVLRHAAVIALYPLVSSHFSLDDLIDIVESKKKKKKIKLNLSTAHDDTYNNTLSLNSASILWEKLIMHIKASPTSFLIKSPTGGDGKKVFGVSLDKMIQRDHIHTSLQKKEAGITLCDFTPTLNACFSDNASIPLFVKTCIMAILQSDMLVEGVFRKNGNIRQLKMLAQSIDNLYETTTSADMKVYMEKLLTNQSSIQLTALLKRYLRELPEPLLTFPLYKLFIQCGKVMNDTIENRDDRLKALHFACCLLPKPNRDTMLMIFCCLKWVSTFSNMNKMDIHNLARIVAPSVLFEKPIASPVFTDHDKRQYSRQGTEEEISVIEVLIREIDKISIIPADLKILALNDVHQDLTCLNSKYFITQYQQLLAELEQQENNDGQSNQRSLQNNCSEKSSQSFQVF